MFLLTDRSNVHTKLSMSCRMENIKRMKSEKKPFNERVGFSHPIWT